MKNNIFKTTALYSLVTAMMVGCGDERSSSPEQADANTFAVGTIGNVGEVDWYEYKTLEANQTLSLTASSNTVRPSIELLVGAYLMKDGKKELLYADHAAEGTATTANVNLNFVIEEPQVVYFSVRDLRDDEYDINDEYRLTLDKATSDGTSSFQDAINLGVSNTQNCQEGVIGERGDLDTFKFTVAEDGVYHVMTKLDKKINSNLNLVIGFYNEDGSLNTLLTENDVVNGGTLYPIIQHLTAGTYYILAKDKGNQYFDNYSPYEVCVSKSEAEEAGENDTQATAEEAQLGQSIEASLEYDGDQDWYQVAVNAVSSTGIKVLTLNLNTSEADPGYKYEIMVSDASGKVLLTHAHNAGSDPYEVELKLQGDGPYFATVQASGNQIFNVDSAGDFLSEAPYTLTVNTIDVDDQYDVDEGNDTQATATLIYDGVTINGKIAYRTDTDYYTISVPGDENKILEVYLATENQQSGGDVDYSVAIISSKIDRLMDDELGSDAATTLKTALLTPKLIGSSNHTYYIRVRDLGDNESDALSGYTLKAVIKDIPITLPTYPAAGINSVTYHSEADEQIDLDQRTSSEKLQLIITEPKHDYNDMEDYVLNLPHMDRQFADDQSQLIFDGIDNNPEFTRTENLDGTVTFETPWIGGYVDYQGDQDFFELDIDALELTGEQTEIDTSWFYDIKVELVAEESDVEYIWKLHTDTNKDRKIGNAMYSSNGDKTKESNAINIVSGGTPNSFWMSNAYKGNYYFKISDNNLMTNANNLFSEADWSVDKPYYFRITLTYHSGVSRYDDIVSD